MKMNIHKKPMYPPGSSPQNSEHIMASSQYNQPLFKKQTSLSQSMILLKENILVRYSTPIEGIVCSKIRTNSNERNEERDISAV